MATVPDRLVAVPPRNCVQGMDGRGELRPSGRQSVVIDDMDCAVAGTTLTGEAVEIAGQTTDL